MINVKNYFNCIIVISKLKNMKKKKNFIPFQTFVGYSKKIEEIIFCLSTK